jgi:hypothetical protein
MEVALARLGLEVMVTDWVWALVSRQGGARAKTLLCERERGGHGAVRSRLLHDSFFFLRESSA